jgi:TonB family protein
MFMGPTPPDAAAGNRAPVVITAPHWLEKPDGDDVARVYPGRTASGNVLLKCRVRRDGRLDPCEVFAETPVGGPFGAAALRLVPKFRMASESVPEGSPAPYFYLPIRFTLQPYAVPAIRIIVAPQWASAPSFDDLARAYPAAATAATATVTMRCALANTGALKDCETRDERPAGQGFADAALALSTRFRLDVSTMYPALNERTFASLAADVQIRFIDPHSDEIVHHRISHPDWVTLPGPDEAAALFPPLAAAKGLKVGQGVIACTVAADGRLADWAPAAAEPDSLGFSEAALKAAAMMRMNPWTKDGGPVDGARVSLPIRFDITPDRP